MEDRFHISGMNTKKSQNITLFAVFDGHGGAEASQYCCDWISYYLNYYWTNVDNIGSSFRSSFRSMDVDFRLSGLTCGTTACSCLVVDKKYVVCANLGDSRAIVIQDNGDFVGISRDHRPSIPEETKRITQLGGAVIYTDQWRVQGKLAVSRAIGDYDLKPFVTSDPEITEYQIQKKDRYLVLGSDGVYDVLENTALAKLVMDYASKRNFMHVAQFVCDQARYVLWFF
jgi:serine/threonine protein phosphatase PrpC